MVDEIGEMSLYVQAKLLRFLNDGSFRRIGGDDVLLLAEHFIERSARQIGRPVPGLSEAARQALRRESWPGNIRQLQNLVFRAVTVSDTPVLDVPDLELPRQLGDRQPEPETARTRAGLEDPATWAAAVDDFERDLLARLYPAFPSSRKLAARLGLSHTVVAAKLRRHGIGQAAAPGNTR